MKKLFSALTLAAVMTAPSWAAPTNYQIDPSHSSVGFSIRHLVSYVEGRFGDISGSIVYDPAKVAASSVNFVVKAASINTSNEKRDEHLRGADFFDVQKFPTLEFHSKKVLPRGKDSFDVVGQLTMHGVTKPITVTVKSLGEAASPFGGQVAGFKTEFVVNRKDFGITYNKSLDKGGTMLGDDVTVRINVEASSKK